MFGIFYWSIDWLPVILQIPIKVTAIILGVLIVIKLVQAIFALISAVVSLLLPFK